MYLGVVREIRLNNERVENNDSVGYLSVDLCNQYGELENIFISTNDVSDILIQGDLVALDYENGKWIVRETINKEKLSIFQILKLEKLIELEKEEAQAGKKLCDEKFNSMKFLFAAEFELRDYIINLLVNRFKLSLKDENIRFEYLKLSLKDENIRFEYLKLKKDKDCVYKQSTEFVERIIFNLQSDDISIFSWLTYASSILYLSSNNEITEELLTMAIEALLNVKVAKNELKSQLEQQLKDKLNELKGKQKKLV